MQDVGNKVERKKNVTDPLNNPVRLFRSSALASNKASISGYSHAVNSALHKSKAKNDNISQKMLLSSKEHSSATRMRKMMMQS